jgi:hypothetical protein
MTAGAQPAIRSGSSRVRRSTTGTEIRSGSPAKRGLVLYACHPADSAAHRFAVLASPVE